MATRHTLSAAASLPFDEIEWVDERGELLQAGATPELLSAPLLTALPYREPANYQNRINQVGRYFWARSGTHVMYESALEADSLLWLDFEGAADQVVAQPFRIDFRAGSAGVWHVPDFFALHGNGDQVVYDVKPSSRMDDRVRDQFAETERVCALVGWRHEVIHEQSPDRAANLEFLRQARTARCHPVDDLYERIISAFSAVQGGRTVAEGRALVDPIHPPNVMPYVRHLLWHQVLVTDLDVRLTPDSVLFAAQEETSCCV